MANRELDTESRYVFDRKYLQSYTGVNLDKPRLLLNRVFTKNTSTSEEEIIDSRELRENTRITYSGHSTYIPYSNYFFFPKSVWLFIW